MVPSVMRAPPPPPAPPLSRLFVDNRFDATGAGLLELGDLDAVLVPFRSDFGDRLDGLPIEVTVDAAGAVIGCTAQGPSRLEAAGQALCAHARAQGRFVKNPLLVLEYTQATYRLTVRYPSDRAQSGRRRFHSAAAFPYQGIAVSFGLFPLPPAEERLPMAEVSLAGMEYPLAALREGLEGRVEVLVTLESDSKLSR